MEWTLSGWLCHVYVYVKYCVLIDCFLNTTLIFTNVFLPYFGGSLLILVYFMFFFILYKHLLSGMSILWWGLCCSSLLFSMLCCVLFVFVLCLVVNVASVSGLFYVLLSMLPVFLDCPFLIALSGFSLFTIYIFYVYDTSLTFIKWSVNIWSRKVRVSSILLYYPTIDEVFVP